MSALSSQVTGWGQDAFEGRGELQARLQEVTSHPPVCSAFAITVFSSVAIGWCTLSWAWGVSSCTEEVGCLFCLSYSAIFIVYLFSDIRFHYLGFYLTFRSGLGRRFRMHPGWICAGVFHNIFIMLSGMDRVWQLTIQVGRRVKMLALGMVEVL